MLIRNQANQAYNSDCMSKGQTGETKQKPKAIKPAAKQAAPAHAPATQAPGLLQRAMDSPESLSTADVTALQRQLGNSAVQGILARRNGTGANAAQANAALASPAVAAAPTNVVDAAATSGPADRQREAASGAAQEDEPMLEAPVTAAAGTTHPLGAPNPEDDDSINRKTDANLVGAAENIQRATDTLEDEEPVQRAADLEDDSEIQRRPDDYPVVGLAGGPVQEGLEQRIQGERSGGQPLPQAVQGKVERALDADLSGVRVHTGQSSDTLNRSLGAKAFTTGRDIFFKDGEYDPSSSGGQSLLAHELTHVVQQGAALRRHPKGVQRATGQVAQREAGAYGNQRQEWKEMSTLGKIAMVPGGALYGAGQAAAGTYGGIYSRLAGRNPGRLRQGLAGAGSALLGTMALPFTATAGALRGAFQGIANPIHSIGKRIGSAAGSVPARARGAIGNYGPGLTRQENLLGSTGAAIGSYGLAATGTAATGARVGLDIASRSRAGDFLGSNTLTSSQISGASTAFGVLGAGAGVLGAGAAIADTVTGARAAAQGGLSGSTRALAVGQTLSSAGEAVKQGSMSAYNIASLVSAQGVAVAGAQIVAGGASVAVGAIDMIRGGYGLFQGRKREQLLLEIARDADRASQGAQGDVAQGIPTTPEMQAVSNRWRLIATTARAAARTQATRQTTAGMTMLKGAAAIAGGALLLAATATPIGWALLAGAALIGGIAATVRYFKRKKARRQLIIDALPPDVKASRVEWKRKKAEAEKGSWWGTNTRRDAMRAIGEDPLETWLRDSGFRNVDHAYTKYINDTAQALYDNAVENDQPDMIKLVKALGLTVNKQKKDPKPAVIAAALDR